VKTKPKHWLDFALEPLLKIFWEPFSKKQSHFWRWKRYSGYIENTLTIRGIASEKPRNSFWSNFWQSNFGWKNVVIIKPETKKFYQIGFFDKVTNDKKLCSCLVKGDVGLLAGSNDVEFFAIDEDGNFCEIALLKYSNKHLLPKNIPLL